MRLLPVLASLYLLTFAVPLHGNPSVPWNPQGAIAIYYPEQGIFRVVTDRGRVFSPSQLDSIFGRRMFIPSSVAMIVEPTGDPLRPLRASKGFYFDGRQGNFAKSALDQAEARIRLANARAMIRRFGTGPYLPGEALVYAEFDNAGLVLPHGGKLECGAGPVDLPKTGGYFQIDPETKYWASDGTLNLRKSQFIFTPEDTRIPYDSTVVGRMMTFRFVPDIDEVLAPVFDSYRPDSLDLATAILDKLGYDPSLWAENLANDVDVPAPNIANDVVEDTLEVVDDIPGNVVRVSVKSAMSTGKKVVGATGGILFESTHEGKQLERFMSENFVNPMAQLASGCVSQRDKQYMSQWSSEFSSTFDILWQGPSQGTEGFDLYKRYFAYTVSQSFQTVGWLNAEREKAVERALGGKGFSIIETAKNLQPTYVRYGVHRANINQMIRRANSR